MVICDTSVWIEYFRGKNPYFDSVSALLSRREIIGLECVFGELLQGVMEKRERKVILECWDSLPKLSEAGLWLAAGEYAAIHRVSARGVGLVDAAIAVATLQTGSLLWTLDRTLAAVMPGRYWYWVK